MAEKTSAHILLIDDEDHLLVTLRDYLEYEGFEVSICRSAEEALTRLPVLRPDLVILDICMPGMGGLGFLKAVGAEKGRGVCPPVLVLTARSSMEQFFGNLDVAGFLAKPCSRKDLMSEIRRILGRETAPSREGGEAGRRRILLAEDDGARAEAVKRLFEEEGYDVLVADSGPLVLELAQTQRPHVIVIKTALPGMSGDIVAALLKAMPSTKTIPLILFGTPEQLGGEGDTRFRIPHGVESFLRTCDEYELVRAVRDVVRA